MLEARRVEPRERLLAGNPIDHALRMQGSPPIVQPGSGCFIETPMTAPMFNRADFRDWALSRIPLGRVGEPADVASAVLYLVSPSASMVTGTSLVIDDGWTAQ
jgi:NAD(P)-dependent dehydrogenase (short-subunit alcohol dehydrogenase family)